jgi:hypothetical protein
MLHVIHPSISLTVQLHHGKTLNLFDGIAPLWLNGLVLVHPVTAPLIDEAPVNGFCRSNGYTHYAELGNGAFVFICPMLFNYRAVIGTLHRVEDAYCYDTQDQAVASIEAWDVTVSAEPSGWKKHPQSGRYRPLGHDSTKTT